MDDSILSLQGTTYFIGVIVGSVIWMRLADIIGRKPIILMGLILYGATLLVMFLVKEEWVIFFGYWVMGFQLPNTCQASYLLMMELLAPEHRSRYTSLTNIMDALCNLWLPFFFRYSPSYIYLLIGVAALVVIAFFGVLIITPESPRYLITKKKYAQAHKILATIARCNRKPKPDHIRFHG